MSTSREFYVADFQDLTYSALQVVKTRRAAAWEKLIEETLEKLREWRLADSKFDFFRPFFSERSMFGTPYVEPSRDDAVAHLNQRNWYEIAANDFNKKWDSHEAELDQHLKLCAAKGSDEIIRVGVADYRIVTRWLE